MRQLCSFCTSIMISYKHDKGWSLPHNTGFIMLIKPLDPREAYAVIIFLTDSGREVGVLILSIKYT